MNRRRAKHASRSRALAAHRRSPPHPSCVARRRPQPPTVHTTPVARDSAARSAHSPTGSVFREQGAYADVAACGMPGIHTPEARCEEQRNLFLAQSVGGVFATHDEMDRERHCARSFRDDDRARDSQHRDGADGTAEAPWASATRKLDRLGVGASRARRARNATTRTPRDSNDDAPPLVWGKKCVLARLREQRGSRVHRRDTHDVFERGLVDPATLVEGSRQGRESVTD